MSLSRICLAVALLLAPAVSFAQDEESLDDLGDDFLKEARSDKKGRGDKPADDDLMDEDPDEFPSGGGLDEDPDWDVPPPPIDLGLDEGGGDPLPDMGALPEDSFFDEDPPMDAKPRATAPKAVAAGQISLSTKGKSPLTGSYPAVVVATDLDAVVLELPVLVARQAVDHIEDYWLIAEVYIDERKVGENRNFVGRSGVSDLGPTFVWIKTQAPVLDSSGVIELRVTKMELSGDKSPLFTKKASYRLSS